MFGTYRKEDVTILLKDITGLVKPLGTQEREARIQQGTHYSEMLPLEYEPSQAYLEAYRDALSRYAGLTAQAAASAAASATFRLSERLLIIQPEAARAAPTISRGTWGVPGMHPSRAMTRPEVRMALGWPRNCRTTSSLRLPSETVRVTTMAVAVEIISEGTWLTSPSPMVAME